MSPDTENNIHHDEELLQEAVKFGNIFRTMNECLWIGDRQHKTVYVNPMFERLSGYKLKECIGRDCTSFFDEKGKKIIEQHHSMRRGGHSSQYEATMIAKDGRKVPLLISGAPTTSDGTIGVFTNLTELKKLARQEKVAQHILQHSREAIVILDEKRNIKLWSSGAKKMFGYKESEILNTSISRLIPEQRMKENRAIMKIVKEKHHYQNFETQRLHKNGQLLDVSVSITKVFDEDDKFIGYLIFYRDIRDEKRINSELQKRFEAIQDAYKELGLKNRELDYINEIAACGTSNENLNVLVNLAISAVALLTKADGAVIRLYQPSTKTLKLESCIGVEHKWWDKNKINFANSLAEEAFKIGRPLIIDDVDKNQKHQGIKLVKDNNFKTLILLPLKLKSRMLGTISLYATDPAKFRLIETDFLDNLSKHISLALYAKIC